MSFEITNPTTVPLYSLQCVECECSFKYSKSEVKTRGAGTGYGHTISSIQCPNCQVVNWL